MITVTDIWRYPLKGIGRETVDAVDLIAEHTMTGDRIWAVAQEGTDMSPVWRSCRNFARGAKAPHLQAISSRTMGDGAIVLTHPTGGEISVSLPQDGPRVIEWLCQFWPKNRPALTNVTQAHARGMTDSDYPSVSIMNHASLRALSQKSGYSVEAERFRGNIWIDGAAPWEEHDLIGKTITLGGTSIEIIESIQRCLATHANPKSGQRDIDMLEILNRDWGHQNFGVNGIVKSNGKVAIGDVLAT